MRSRIVRLLSVLSFVAIAVIVLFARRAGSDPPPADCVWTISIDGMPGESRVVPGAIDVLSFSWGVDQTRRHGEPPERGRVEFSDFNFVKKLDKASPNLMLACAQGQHVNRAVVEARKAGPPQEPYLKYTLEEVLVTSFKPGGSCDGGDGVPQEEVALNFGKITFSYAPQQADGGSSGPPVRTCWDVRRGRSCE